MKKIIYCSVIYFHALLSANVNAETDLGLWCNVAIRHQVTSTVSVSIAEEIRWRNNISSLDSYFTDAGLEYEFNSWKASVNYRFINKMDDDFISQRHRFYFDIAYKIKVRKFIFSARQRIQEQFSDYYSSETGKIPEWYSRTKFQVKRDLDKKYEPYISFEMYYLIDNLDETDRVIDRFRYETGLEYEFNRRYKAGAFFLLQHDLFTKEIEINPGVTFLVNI
jgi:hypothetical protein